MNASLERVDCSALESPAHASAMCSKWFAVPGDKEGGVLLWQDEQEEDGCDNWSLQPRRLQGLHTTKVSALRFWSGRDGSIVLFTASADCVARWNVDGEDHILEVSQNQPPPEITVLRWREKTATAKGHSSKGPG